MWGDFLVIIIVDPHLLKAVSFVKPLRLVVGYLDVKIHLVDLGLYVGGGSCQDKFKGLRTKFARTIRLHRS